MNKLKATLRQPLPNISTPQAKGSQTVDLLFYTTTKPNQSNTSNISFLRNDRSQTKQDQYYHSPILSQTQIDEVERQSKKRKNEFYSQMLSENPYNFPESIEEMPKQFDGVSEIALDLWDLKNKGKVNQMLLETSSYADQLSYHSQRIKPTNTIIQRQDVIKLAQWIDVMMKKIITDSDKVSSYEQIKQIELVFNMSLKELVREISIDCLEKSVLLEKVWTQYAKFNTAVIDEIQQAMLQEETAHLEEMKSLHKTYQMSIGNLEGQLKQKTEDYDKLKNKYQRKKVKCQHLINLTQNQHNQLTALQSELHDAKLDRIQAIQEKERIQAQFKALEGDYTKLQDQYSVKHNEVRLANLRMAKRQSTQALEYIADENTKSTSTYDIVTTMNLLISQGQNTDDPPVFVSTFMQTEFKGMRSIGVQAAQSSREHSMESFQSPRNNPSNDELRKLKEKIFALEEQLRIENTNSQELRKQKQQLQRDNESKAIKIINQDNTIIQLQKEIERLLNELNSKSDSKHVSLIAIDSKDDNQKQFQLAPQKKESLKQLIPNDNETDKEKEKEKENEKEKKEKEIEKDPPKSTQQSQKNSLPQIDDKSQKQTKNNEKQKSEIKQDLKVPQISNSDQKQQQNRKGMKSSQKQSQQQQYSTQGEPKKNLESKKAQRVSPTKKSQLVSQNVSKDELQIQEIPQVNEVQQKSKPTQIESEPLKIPQIQQQGNGQIKKKHQKVQQLTSSSEIQQHEQNQKDSKDNHYVDIALDFVNKLSEDLWMSPDSIQPQMPLQNVLKLIQQFYKERLTSKYPIYAVCYEFYMNTFGLKNIAEQKLTMFCTTVFHYRTIPRIQLFGRFLYLYDRLSDEDLDFYMQSLHQLDELNNSQNLLQCYQNQDYVAILYSKAQEQMIALNEQALEVEKKIYNQLINLNGKACLDLDFYFQAALEQFQLIRKIHKDKFKELFIAVDVNDDNFIQVEEFMILYKLVEGLIGMETYIQQFKEACNKYNGLSFYQFGLFCMHHGLFTKEKQDKFSRVTDIESQLQDLKVKWDDLRKEVTKRLKKACQFSSYYQDLVRKCNEAIQNNLQYAWLLWRILEDMSKQIYLDYLASQYICKPLNQIQSKYEQFLL